MKQEDIEYWAKIYRPRADGGTPRLKKEKSEKFGAKRRKDKEDDDERRR